MHMKAAVVHDFTKPLVLEEVPQTHPLMKVKLSLRCRPLACVTPTSMLHTAIGR